MGFEIHMCYWNFTCESHVNHMGNTSQFSVRAMRQFVAYIWVKSLWLIVGAQMERV